MLLKLKGLKKYFSIKKSMWGTPKSFVRAVDEVDLTIWAGKNLSIVGESGSGKTTIARLILGLITCDSGQIFFEGNEIGHLSNKDLRPFRQQMQMVFQDPYSSLDPRFTIYEILKEATTLNRYHFQTSLAMHRRTEELLSAVQLKTDILNRYPHEFSGGERQRIAIARALMINPKLLILDEAVSSLDVLVQEQIIRLLLEIQKNFGLTYLFISHNLRVVRKISHTIAVMYKGKIVELASTQEIFRNPLHPYTQELFAAAIHYQPVKRIKDYEIPEDAVLQDTGNEHFVLQ